MRVALVGTGIAGLTCAHVLREGFDLEVFEAEARPGGHTNTVPVELGGRRLEVDTGFIVFNRRAYPGFVRLLEELGVGSRETEMSFGFRDERTGLEYAGRGWKGLLAQRRNLLRPAFHRMLRDLLRFFREARALLDHPEAKASLGDWLWGKGFSRELVDWHLVPMGSAIWSADPERFLEMPARTFLRFFENHGLLSLRDRPVWRTVAGGSVRYVERLTAPLGPRLRCGEPVLGVRRLPEGGEGVELRLRGGRRERFDAAILACHSDQALALLETPTPLERRVLGAIRYQANVAVLHTDASVLPRSRRAWAAWNARRPLDPKGHATVTYRMNALQGLDAPEELCVTLNPEAGSIDPARVLRRIPYAHPVLDAGAVEAQALHGAVSGADRIHYCGAYWGYGFHEDGLQSALRVTRRFGRGLRA